LIGTMGRTVKSAGLFCPLPPPPLPPPPKIPDLAKYYTCLPCSPAVIPVHYIGSCSDSQLKTENSPRFPWTWRETAASPLVYTFFRLTNQRGDVSLWNWTKFFSKAGKNTHIIKSCMNINCFLELTSFEN
jgi:hypothetical protein